MAKPSKTSPPGLLMVTVTGPAPMCRNAAATRLAVTPSPVHQSYPITSMMLIVRSASSLLAAWIPGSQRSNTAGAMKVFADARGRPPGAAGRFFMLMGFPSRLFVVQPGGQCGAGLLVCRGAAKLIQGRKRGLHSEHRSVAAHGLPVLELAHLVAGQDAVVDHDAVEGCARGAVCAQQTLHRELRVEAQALRRGEQVLGNGLLDTLEPGPQRERQKAD